MTSLSAPFLAGVGPAGEFDPRPQPTTGPPMKMETALESPVDGHVVEVLVGSGDQAVSSTGRLVLATTGPGA